MMQKLGLQLKLQLENVEEVVAEGEDFRWFIKVCRLALPRPYNTSRRHTKDISITLLSATSTLVISVIAYIHSVVGEVLQLWRSDQVGLRHGRGMCNTGQHAPLLYDTIPY